MQHDDEITAVELDGILDDTETLTGDRPTVARRSGCT